MATLHDINKTTTTTPTKGSEVNDIRKIDDNRKKALDAALTQIERQFGKGTVMRMSDGEAIRDVEIGRAHV